MNLLLHLWVKGYIVDGKSHGLRCRLVPRKQEKSRVRQHLLLGELCICVWIDRLLHERQQARLCSVFLQRPAASFVQHVQGVAQLASNAERLLDCQNDSYGQLYQTGQELRPPCLRAKRLAYKELGCSLRNLTSLPTQSVEPLPKCGASDDVQRHMLQGLMDVQAPVALCDGCINKLHQLIGTVGHQRHERVDQLPPEGWICGGP
mmetsp:Transcript_114476/g.199132  ORF Transcript_114476/g.199132 Transcript_114476/m.199132 type:complete len:205 (-) Transcript_114476:445-1059(-)